MSTGAEGEVYRLGGFVLDQVRGSLLTDSGEEVPLRHKSFQLLCLLVGNAGRLLSREVITKAIWHGVNISDDGITQCVRDIRRALGDEAQAKLKTIPRRGYIFTGEVALDQGSGSPFSDPPLPVRPSIAVLAFANMSADPEQEYFSDGIADDIITELARHRSLFVIARNTSFSYRERPIDVKQVGRKLGVRYLVEGSVRRYAGRVRVTAQLIDAIDGNHIWAERYDRDLADVFAVQDEISTTVATAIYPAISNVEQQRSLRKPPETLGAWEAWQRALWHWSKGSDLATRRVFLTRAVELDPHFAPAHAALAWLYLSESTRGLGPPLSVGAGLAEVEARAALDLDPYSPIAHAALAWVYDHQGDQDAALEEAEIAISLNPNDPQGYAIKGHILAVSGRPTEAEEPLATALRLDPRGPTAPAVMYNRAVGSYLAYDYLAAEATTRHAVRAYPEHPRSYLLLAAALGQLGRIEEARSALDAAIAASPSYVKMKTQSRAPFMLLQDHEHVLDGLRKAGWQD